MSAENITQGVGAKFVTATAEFNRATGTTQYTAGDLVAGASPAYMIFPNVARSKGGSGAIIKARLTTSKKDDTGAYRLILFTRSSLTTPAITALVADNAADKLIYADRVYVVGQIDFPAATSGADTSNSTGASALWTGGIGSTTVASGPLPFKCYEPGAGGDTSFGDTNLYGKLVALGTPTPADSQSFSIELTALQN